MNSQENNPIDVNNMIDRLKEEENVQNDGDFAELVDMKPSTLSMARKRNSINLIQILKYFEGYSSDWIFYGIEPKFLDDKAVREPERVEYQSKDDMVRRIRNMDASPEQKLDLLNLYIDLLEQAETKNKD